MNSYLQGNTNDIADSRNGAASVFANRSSVGPGVSGGMRDRRNHSIAGYTGTGPTSVHGPQSPQNQNMKKDGSKQNISVLASN